jgi:ferritin-like metal-binding protein YciE
MDDAASVLDDILEQEKNADESLTEIAVNTINVRAAEMVEEEAEEEEEE